MSLSKIQIKFENDTDGEIRQEVLEIALNNNIYPYSSSKEDSLTLIFKDEESNLSIFKQHILSRELDCTIDNILLD